MSGFSRRGWMGRGAIGSAPSRTCHVLSWKNQTRPEGGGYPDAMHGTIGDALNAALSRLAASPSPQAEAEELLGRLVGLGRTDLYLRRGQALEPEQWTRLDSWLRRRSHGEPLQYITGRAAFRGL